MGGSADIQQTKASQQKKLNRGFHVLEDNIQIYFLNIL